MRGYNIFIKQHGSTDYARKKVYNISIHKKGGNENGLQGRFERKRRQTDSGNAFYAFC